VILLVWVGLLDYQLPTISGARPCIWVLGALFCAGLPVARSSRGQVGSHNGVTCDRRICCAVWVYFILIYFSRFLTHARYGLAEEALRAIDYSLLFILAVRCIRTERDVVTLLKGLVLGTFLMAAVGLMGYVENDPWWGHTIYDGTTEMRARAMAGTSFTEKIQAQIWLEKGRDVSEIGARARFTADSPNDLATTMLLAFPILAYFWPKARNLVHKPAIVAIIFLLTASIFLAASRTGIIAGCLMLLFLFLAMFRLRLIRKPQSLVVITLTLAVVGSLCFFSPITDTAKARIKKIENTRDLVAGHGRVAKWKRHLQGLTPSLLIIGTGSVGAEEGQAHMNYLSTVYRGGFWALIAFFACLFGSMRNALKLHGRLMGLCLFTSLLTFAVCGIALDSSAAKGPNFIFWPIVAILAKSRKVHVARRRWRMKSLYPRRSGRTLPGSLFTKGAEPRFLVQRIQTMKRRETKICG